MRKCVLFAAVTAMLMTACGGARDVTVGDQPKVALVMKSLANEFFKTMEEGAREYHASRPDDFELIVNGIRNEEDIGAQVMLVEQMMARGVDAIVIAPADSKALTPVLARAAAEGIVVVNIDNRLDASVLEERDLRIPFVGPDNREGARMAGEYLAEHLEPDAKVAIVGGIPSAFNAIQRRQGFEDAMEAAGIDVVATQSGNWEMTRANTVVAGIITEHPDISAVLCANDSMALGAVAALDAAGRRDVAVVGYDNISAVQELIRNGRMLCTIDQHADQLAVYGIQAALDIVSGGAPPEDRETPVDLITAADLP